MLTPTDDRGRKCAVAGLTPRQLGIRALGVRRLADSHSQEEMSLTSQSEIAWAIGGGVVGAVVWQVVHWQWPVFGIVGLFVGFIVVSVCAAMIVWWLTLGRVRRGKFRHLSDVYLSTGQCAGCAYQLTGLDAEDDDCVVCPECGAAWLHTRIAVAKDNQ